MRPVDTATRRAQLQKRMIKAGIIGMPGCVLFALGLNALFGGTVPMAWMADRDAALSMLGVAGVLLIWELLIIVPTALELGRLNRESQASGSSSR